MGLDQPLSPYPQALPGTKNDKVTAWDLVYSLNVAVACLITYWIITYLLSGFVDQPSNFLRGMWAVVAAVFVFRGHPCPRPVCGNRAADSNRVSFGKQPLLRLVETVVGIALGVTFKWICKDLIPGDMITAYTTLKKAGANANH